MVKNLSTILETWGSSPGSRRSPEEGNGLPTPIFLPGGFQGQRSLTGYSAWVTKSGTLSYFQSHLLIISQNSLSLSVSYDASPNTVTSPRIPLTVMALCFGQTDHSKTQI